jgi:RNA-directed DNA polymerase
MKRYGNLFESVCDLENLYAALRVCLRGKRYKGPVLRFTANLSEEMLRLQEELETGAYRVSPYFGFYVTEPKVRWIEALPFRDRVVQQALCQVIGPIMEKTFIADSFACLVGRGTHAGSARLQGFIRKAQARYGRAWCLQGDIHSYFPSISHDVLLEMFERKIKCRRTLDLIKLITNSNGKSVGIPIGNLLSQLSANVYLTPFDYFIKERLRVKYYIRYMDDFCLIHGGKKYLRYLMSQIEAFVRDRLQLQSNGKTGIFPLEQGVDFLGYRTWATHKLLRKRSIKRMRRKLKAMRRKYIAGEIDRSKIDATVSSWTAHAMHANTYRLRSKIFGAFNLPIRGDSA